MGFEYLLAALLMSASEKNREKRRLAQEETERSGEKEREMKVETHLAGKDYDLRRQNELTALAKSTLREDHREFSRILGRPYCEEDVAVEWAIRAIADREEWTYYRRDELIYDEEYCRLLGWMPPSREVVERFEEELKELQRKERIWRGWVERNPKCWEVKVSPEFYESEEQFAFMIDYEYEKKRWQ